MLSLTCGCLLSWFNSFILLLILSFAITCFVEHSLRSSNAISCMLSRNSYRLLFSNSIFLLCHELIFIIRNLFISIGYVDPNWSVFCVFSKDCFFFKSDAVEIKFLLLQLCVLCIFESALSD